jgi:hypothetical protein
MKIIIILLLVFISSVYSGHNIDVQGRVTGGEHNAGDKALSEWQGGIRLDYSGKINLSEKMSILVSENLDGITGATDYSPVREYNHPGNSITTLGLEYSGTSTVQAEVFSQIYFNSDWIGFPIDDGSQSYLLDASMLKRNRSGFDLFAEIPFEKVLVAANLLYNHLLYDYSRFDHVELNQRDADLWATGLIGIQLAKKKKLSITLGGLVKSDINDYNGYNFYQGYGGFKSVLRLFKKKLDIRASLLGRFIASPVIEEQYKNYADGIGVLPRVRFYWKMKPRNYLKGDFDWELAPTTKTDGWFVKQRYELAYRKAGREYSAMEFGGWMSLGSLQPRICTYGNGIISVNHKFEIMPGIRAYFLGQSSEEWIVVDTLSGYSANQDIKKIENGKMVHITKDGIKSVRESYSFDKYQYYRTDLDLTFRHKLYPEEGNIFKHLTIYYGGQYQLYTNVTENQDAFESPFISTFRIICGIASFL